jgi:hypothetical protein
MQYLIKHHNLELQHPSLRYFTQKKKIPAKLICRLCVLITQFVEYFLAPLGTLGDETWDKL